MAIWELRAALAVLLFLLIAPALVVPWLRRLYGDHGRFAGLPAVMMAAELLYVCGLVAATLLPVPDSIDDTRFCLDRGKGWRLEPLVTFRAVLEAAGEDGLTVLYSGQFLQLFLNVLMLVPLGFFVAFRLRRPLWAAAAAGLLVSLLVETTQGTGVWWIFECPYRLGEIDDLVTNTTGAAVGWLVGRAVGRRVPYPEPRLDPVAGAPTIGRRALANVVDVIAWVVVAVLSQVALLAPVVWWYGTAAVTTDWFGTATTVIGVVGPAVVLLAVVPLVRRDGATVGQWAVHLAVAGEGGGVPSARAVLTRAAVRWSPLVVAATFGGRWWVLASAWAVAEAVATARSRDGRSPASRAARTVTVAADARRSSRHGAGSDQRPAPDGFGGAAGGGVG